MADIHILWNFIFSEIFTFQYVETPLLQDTCQRGEIARYMSVWGNPTLQDSCQCGETHYY